MEWRKVSMPLSACLSSAEANLMESPRDSFAMLMLWSGEKQLCFCLPLGSLLKLVRRFPLDRLPEWSCSGTLFDMLLVVD